MAAFTTTDLDTIRTAIRTAVTEGVAEVSIAGQAVKAYSLDELYKLYERVAADVAADSTATGASGGIRRRQFTPYYP